MPRQAARPRVPRINLEVVKRAFRSLPAKGASDYYILEKNDGPCLRVRRRVVQIGVRYRSRFHCAAHLRPDMTLEEVEEAREEARRLLRRLDEEESMPGLARGRSMTLRQLYQEYMADFLENRGTARSRLTFVSYESLWRLHILPVLGDLRLCEITSEAIRQFKRQLPERVLKARPWAKSEGKPITNRSLQQLNTALGFAYRMEWITRNPASARLVPRFEENRAEEFLDDKGYAAVGEILRDLEDRLMRGKESPLSQGTLNALRVAIYTGVRHRSELLLTRLDWCHLDGDVPRIGIPRAKGNRAKGGGRWIFLGPDAVRRLRAIPRPAGSEHLTVPGRLPGRPLVRLNGPWTVVLRAAGLPAMTVKVLRHGFSTHSVGIIAPEHRAQLLGHQGRPMTDTVYLHHHGPDLARAAALVEDRLRGLLGDQRPESSRIASSRICARPAGPRWWRQ
jgi:integrase